MRYPLGSTNPLPAGELRSEIARAISREDMAKLAIRRYEGRLCLVATPEDLEEARSDLRQESCRELYLRFQSLGLLRAKSDAAREA